MNKISKTFQYGQHTITLETGRVARQATGSVWVTMGDTVVLVTAVGKSSGPAGRDFFPLTVNYQEKSYAAGKIPGGYFKREGRPTEKETLTSRLIDRPIRPLFPDEFTDEVQIVATVLSLDPQVQTDIPSIIGAAAALGLTGMPFQGPLAAARVGYRDGAYLLNPSSAEIKTSQLDLVVAGTREAGSSTWTWTPHKTDATLEERIKNAAETDVKAAYQIHKKTERQTRIGEILKKLTTEICVGDNAPTT